LWNLGNLFLHFFCLKWNCLLSEFSRWIIFVVGFQIILKSVWIYIIRFENVTDDFSLLAFVIVSTLYFRKIFLELRTVGPLSNNFIIFIVRTVLVIVSYSPYAYIWILNIFSLIELISIVVKTFFRWVVIFFNCYLTLLHQSIVRSIFGIVLLDRMLLMGSIFKWKSFFKDFLIFWLWI